jgi:hypothetical protein
MEEVWWPYTIWESLQVTVNGLPTTLSFFITSHLPFGLTRSGHDGKTAVRVSDLEIQSRD